MSLSLTWSFVADFADIPSTSGVIISCRTFIAVAMDRNDVVWDEAVFADTVARGGFRQNRTIERLSVSACEQSNLGVSY